MINHIVAATNESGHSFEFVEQHKPSALRLMRELSDEGFDVEMRIEDSSPLFYFDWNYNEFQEREGY